MIDTIRTIASDEKTINQLSPFYRSYHKDTLHFEKRSVPWLIGDFVRVLTVIRSRFQGLNWTRHGLYMLVTASDGRSVLLKIAKVQSFIEDIKFRRPGATPRDRNDTIEATFYPDDELQQDRLSGLLQRLRASILSKPPLELIPRGQNWELINKPEAMWINTADAEPDMQGTCSYRQLAAAVEKMLQMMRKHRPDRPCVFSAKLLDGQSKLRFKLILQKVPVAQPKTEGNVEEVATS